MTEQWSQTCTLNNNPTWLWKINYALTFISSSIWLDSDISYILVLESFWKAMFVDSGQSTRMRLGSCKEGYRGSREEIREGVSLYSHIGTWPYGLMFMDHIKKKSLKWTVPSKMKIPSSFTRLNVVPKLCFLLSSVEHTRRYLCIFASHTIEVNLIWLQIIFNVLLCFTEWWRYFHFWVSYIFITLHFLYCVLSWLKIVISACIIVLYCPL